MGDRIPLHRLDCLQGGLDFPGICSRSSGKGVRREGWSHLSGQLGLFSLLQLHPELAPAEPFLNIGITKVYDCCPYMLSSSALPDISVCLMAHFQAAIRHSGVTCDALVNG